MRKYLVILIVLAVSLTVLGTDFLGPVWKYENNNDRSSTRTNWYDGSSQQYLYLYELSGADAGSLTSANFNLNGGKTSNIEYRGTWGATLMLSTGAGDTTAEGAAQADIDSFFFKPRYYLGPVIGFVVGDTIQWRAAVDVNEGTADSVDQWLELPTDTGKKWFWKTNPTDTLLQGFPYNLAGLIMYWRGDSTAAYVRQYIYKY